jgi:hypothetical protein
MHYKFMIVSLYKNSVCVNKRVNVSLRMFGTRIIRIHITHRY